MLHFLISLHFFSQGIPDPLFKRSKDVGHTWGYGNNLVAFPTDFSKSSMSSIQNNLTFLLSIILTTTGSTSMPSMNKLFAITWERTLYNAHVRKLVNESCSAFTSVQLRAAEGQISCSQLIKSSHQYRCVMNACIEDLNQAADIADSKENSSTLQEMSEIFYKAELVWNLCEIMYLENQLGILPHLLEWIRIHFPSAVDETGIVLSSPNPAQHDNYWKALYGLVFQLRLDSAIKLLRIHPSFSTDAFQSAFELLKKMPVFNVIKLFT